LLAGLFPQARFVHIIRDVRDYALSLNRAFGKDLLRSAQRWADDVADARRAGHALAGRYLELRYEDLIRDPNATMQAVCGLADCRFDPNMARLTVPAERHFEQQGGAGTGKTEIVSDNRNKWHGAISARTRAAIERIACETLRECGYEVPAETRRQRLSALSMNARQLLDGINLLRTNRRFSTLYAAKFYWRAYITGAPKFLRLK
jgi:hypothetical protein